MLALRKAAEQAPPLATALGRKVRVDGGSAAPVSEGWD